MLIKSHVFVWAELTHFHKPLGPVCVSVNVGDYIEAVLDRNLAENISRVLYPNDNVSPFQISNCIYKCRIVLSGFVEANGGVRLVRDHF